MNRDFPLLGIIKTKRIIFPIFCLKNLQLPPLNLFLLPMFYFSKRRPIIARKDHRCLFIVHSPLTFVLGDVSPVRSSVVESHYVHSGNTISREKCSFWEFGNSTNRMEQFGIDLKSREIHCVTCKSLQRIIL